MRIAQTARSASQVASSTSSPNRVCSAIPRSRATRWVYSQICLPLENVRSQSGFGANENE